MGTQQTSAESFKTEQAENSANGHQATECANHPAPQATQSTKGPISYTATAELRNRTFTATGINCVQLGKRWRGEAMP